MTCVTCGGDVGEHYGQCPEGAASLWSTDELATVDMLRQASGLAAIPRDTLRLALTDAELIQPNLFTEEITI